MPTQFTRTAGSFAYFAAGLWVLVVASFVLENQIDQDWSTPIFIAWAALVMMAGAFGTVAAAGIRQRNNERRGLAMAGLIVLGLGVAVSFLVAWAVPLWMGIQGIGLVLVVAAHRPVTPATIALGSGMLIGVGVFIALTVLQVGTPDSYGDYPIAWQFGLASGALITAAGLVGVGRDLRAEEPAFTSGEPVSA